MDNQSKFVLTVDANGVVANVQQLGGDGALIDVPLREFFSQLTVPDSSFSGSGTVVIKPYAAGSNDPPQKPQGPSIRQPPPPPPGPPPRQLPPSPPGPVSPRQPPSPPPDEKTPEN